MSNLANIAYTCITVQYDAQKRAAKESILQNIHISRYLCMCNCIELHLYTRMRFTELVVATYRIRNVGCYLIAIRKSTRIIFAQFNSSCTYALCMCEYVYGMFLIRIAVPIGKLCVAFWLQPLLFLLLPALPFEYLFASMPSATADIFFASGQIHKCRNVFI